MTGYKLYYQSSNRIYFSGPGGNVQKANGFSLIEVLVALMILSIGILGVAGLQATSKRTSYAALQRTTATMLTQDILERIRANADQLTAYNGTVDTTTISYTDCAASSANCTPAQLATYDLYEWQQAILGATEQSSGSNTGGLVSPTGCITVATGCTSCLVTVAIAWRGLTKLSNPSVDTCGDASGNYNDTGTDNVYRRVIAVNSFITP